MYQRIHRRAQHIKDMGKRKLGKGMGKEKDKPRVVHNQPGQTSLPTVRACIMFLIFVWGFYWFFFFVLFCFFRSSMAPSSKNTHNIQRDLELERKERGK